MHRAATPAAGGSSSGIDPWPRTP